jgi:hypothetical protein
MDEESSTTQNAAEKLESTVTSSKLESVSSSEDANSCNTTITTTTITSTTAAGSSGTDTSSALNGDAEHTLDLSKITMNLEPMPSQRPGVGSSQWRGVTRAKRTGPIKWQVGAYVKYLLASPSHLGLTSTKLRRTGADHEWRI